MMIALSASFYSVPVVAEALQGCDLVYTTNVDKRDEIREAVGRDAVRFIPTSAEWLLNCLRAQEPEAEFLTYGDLRRIIRQSLLAKEKPTAVALAKYFDWTIEGIQLRDEHSLILPGNRWISRDGDEFDCHEDDVPDQVFERMAHGMA